MKKIKTILAAAALLLATTAFATGSEKNKISSIVKEAFITDFAKAERVSWSENSDYYFAHFTLSGVETEAVYNTDGELVATLKKIDVDRLPASVLSELKKYDGYCLSAKVTEMNIDGSSTYYLTAQDNTHLLELKCTTNGDVNVVKKTKKVIKVIVPLS